MISIVPHRPSWSVEFQEIAARLRAGIGEMALRVDHIGSTSVPNLCAKDVIDLQVTVAKLDGGVAERLRQLGFVQRPEIEGDHVPPGYTGPEGDWAKLFFVQPKRATPHQRSCSSTGATKPTLCLALSRLPCRAPARRCGVWGTQATSGRAVGQRGCLRGRQRPSGRSDLLRRGGMGFPFSVATISERGLRSGAVRPNPSLHPKCYSGLRPLPPSGELKR